MAATIADAANYAANAWVNDPARGVISTTQFTFVDTNYKPVYAPAGKQDIGRARNSQGNLISNNGVYEHNVDGIKKRYVHRYFETHPDQKLYGTTYTGTHYIRTHVLRSITANKHTYISSQTVHINSEAHEALGFGAQVITGSQYTDVVGTDMPAQSVNLDWNDTSDEWELSAAEAAKIALSTDEVVNYQNSYIIQNNMIYPLTSDDTALRFAADTDSIVAGLSAIVTTLQGPEGVNPPLTNFGGNAVSADAPIADLVAKFLTT